MNSGRIVGLLMIGAALAIGLIGMLWLGSNLSEGGLRLTGAVLGGGLLLILILPLAGAGVFMLVRSGREAVEEAERVEMRKIIDIVKSRGQIPISELVLEIGSSRDKVQHHIHSLVGMGLFSGYINWGEGILYSEDASGLQGLERCKHCGGEIKLAGKGVATCPYCGTEYFLS